MLQSGPSPSCAVQHVLMGQNEIESFGVDEAEGCATEEEQQRVVVPPSPYQLSEQQTLLVENVRQTLPNDHNGTQTYLTIRQYI